MLLIFGTHTLRTADNGAEVQSFRPYAFSLALSESQRSYSKLFKCCKHVAQESFGMELKLNTFVSDKSQQCQNACDEDFPDAKRMLCWPHISRSALCQHRGLLIDQDNFKFVQSGVQARVHAAAERARVSPALPPRPPPSLRAPQACCTAKRAARPRMPRRR